MIASERCSVASKRPADIVLDIAGRIQKDKDFQYSRSTRLPDGTLILITHPIAGTCILGDTRLQDGQEIEFTVVNKGKMIHATLSPEGLFEVNQWNGRTDIETKKDFANPSVAAEVVTEWLSNVYRYGYTAPPIDKLSTL